MRQICLSDHSDWEGPHGKLVWQHVCKESPPAADLTPSPTLGSGGPQNAEARQQGMQWRQEWCSRADQTGAHVKDVVSFPLIVLIHSVLPMFWWKWCVWLAGRGVGWRHFCALLYIAQSAVNLYPSSNFSAAKREVWGSCNSQDAIHTCNIPYLLNFKTLSLVLGFVLEEACATSLILTHKPFSPFAHFFQSLFPWISLFALLSTRYLPVLAHSFLQVPLWTYEISPLSFHMSSWSWGFNPEIAPFKSSETLTASALRHFCCPCSTPGFSVLF